MHSFTYTQKKAAGRMPAAEMHMFICVHFFHHAQTPAGRPAGKK